MYFDFNWSVCSSAVNANGDGVGTDNASNVEELNKSNCRRYHSMHRVLRIWSSDMIIYSFNIDRTHPYYIHYFLWNLGLLVHPRFNLIIIKSVFLNKLEHKLFQHFLLFTGKSTVVYEYGFYPEWPVTRKCYNGDLRHA